jgi:GT2 family glycosyltransferase
LAYAGINAAKLHAGSPGERRSGSAVNSPTVPDPDSATEARGASGHGASGRHGASGVHAATGARVVRNDWSRLAPPPVGDWTPTMPVSVIIPAYNCQASLDLVLAALSRQTYPPELLETIVVDDGSEPALRLPDLRPRHCRIVRVSQGWGIGNAVNLGTGHAAGEIVHRIDADMVVFPRHVEAQARWHHVTADAVTLGYKRFVNDGWTTPEEVVRRCADGTIGSAFPDDRTEPHGYIERLIDSTDALRAGDHLVFLAHVGASVAMRRDLYAAVGGLSRELALGEDTELAFRLAQAGAVFIPEPQAQSWHMGRSSMTLHGDALRRFNQPHLADLMPQPRWLRRGVGRVWRVPLVSAVVPATGPFEVMRTCVDRLLAGDEFDLRVHLVAPWDAITHERRSVLDDPLLDLRLLAATYRSDPRVVLATEAPDTVFPSPYRLDVPANIGVGRSTVRRLVAIADREKLGLVRSGPLQLWRTAAVSRALRVRASGESLVDAVAEVYGERRVTGAGMVDLARLSPAALAAAGPRPGGSGGGLRSLARAARLGARHFMRLGVSGTKESKI